MSSVNKQILLGRCGKDPETRTAGSTSVASISLATSEKYTNKQGEKVENTTWHNLEFWGKLADIASQYIKKGDMIYVEGTTVTDKWQDKEGNDRYTTKVKVKELTMLGGNQTVSQPQTAGSQAVSASEVDDDLPF